MSTATFEKHQSASASVASNQRVEGFQRKNVANNFVASFGTGFKVVEGRSGAVSIVGGRLTKPAPTSFPAAIETDIVIARQTGGNTVRRIAAAFTINKGDLELKLRTPPEYVRLDRQKIKTANFQLVCCTSVRLPFVTRLPPTPPCRPVAAALSPTPAAINRKTTNDCFLSQVKLDLASNKKTPAELTVGSVLQLDLQFHNVTERADEADERKKTPQLALTNDLRVMKRRLPTQRALFKGPAPFATWAPRTKTRVLKKTRPTIKIAKGRQRPHPLLEIQASCKFCRNYIVMCSVVVDT